jgi:hypothetical protein
MWVFEYIVFQGFSRSSSQKTPNMLYFLESPEDVESNGNTHSLIGGLRLNFNEFLTIFDKTGFSTYVCAILQQLKIFPMAPNYQLSHTVGFLATWGIE